MPEFNLPNLYDISKEDLIEIVAKMNKTLTWLLSNLDSLNVREINTNITTVSSEEGETIIDGPLLVMYDKQATPVLRLKMGYNPETDEFVFTMYNKTGTPTMGIDASGNATFTGTITGGTIRTAETGQRIEITGNSFVTYNADNQKMGMALGQGYGSIYGDVSFFDTDVEVMRIENQLIGGGYNIKPMNGAALSIGVFGETIILTGNINHYGTIGFFSNPPVAKTTVSNMPAATAGATYGTNEQTMLQNVYDKLNELIDALQNYGLV